VRAPIPKEAIDHLVTRPARIRAGEAARSSLSASAMGTLAILCRKPAGGDCL